MTRLWCWFGFHRLPFVVLTGFMDGYPRLNCTRCGRWTLYARNGRKIATCGEGYKNRKHATKMVRLLFGIVI